CRPIEVWDDGLQGLDRDDASLSCILLLRSPMASLRRRRTGFRRRRGKSHPPESNRRPTDYESVALPTELGWRRLKASLGSRSPLGGQVAASTPPRRPGLKIHPSGGDDLVEPLDEPIDLLGIDAPELPTE